MNDHEKILIIAEDGALAKRVEQTLDGIASFHHVSGVDSISSVYRDVRPGLVLVDANLGDDVAIGVCKKLRTMAQRELAVLALVAKMDDTTLAFLLEAGADDVVGRRLKRLSFRARVNSHLRRVNAARRLKRRVHDSEVLINATASLVDSTEVLNKIRDVSVLVASELDVDRCSVVLVRPEHELGIVLASSDDPQLHDLEIDLRLYPEISKAVQGGEPLVIDNVSDSTLLKDVLPDVVSAGVTSVALFPIARGHGNSWHTGETLGVIFLRFKGFHTRFQQRELVFCQTLANAIAISLSNAKVLEQLKAQSHNLQRYEDFFISALDGMAVLKQSGKVVFLNPRAQKMLDRTAAQYEGRPFGELLVAGERGRFEELLGEFLMGEAGRAVDFHIRRGTTKERTLSIFAGSLFGEEGLMLLTIRDVTGQRATEKRLANAQMQLVLNEKRLAIAQLAGATAHELNQPLTSVMTSLAFLQRLTDNDNQKRIMSTMEEEIDRMASLIRRLTCTTEYKTIDYVGDSKIIDLEGASPDFSAKTGNKGR